MEKKIWTRPLAQVETFMANEYIAKCEDTVNKYYEFVCNAGGGAYGGGWQESNGVEGLQSTSSGSTWQGTYVEADTRISRSSSSFHACGATHYAPIDSAVFLKNCYYKKSRQADSEAIPVIIWRGLNNDNVHCTTFLEEDIEIVQGNKS